MAEFKKLSDVEIVETPMDTANVLIEENGVVKKAPKEAIGGGAKSWNELEDKPFYDARKQVDKFVIEWDGSIEGREITSPGEGWIYVKVTDEVFPYNEYNNGRIYLYSIANNSPMDDFSVNGGLWSSMGENLYSLNLDPGPICIIALSDVEFESAHFTKGVWYLRQEQYGYYASNMEFENVVVGELKTLDEKYIPNSVQTYYIVRDDTNDNAITAPDNIFEVLSNMINNLEIANVVVYHKVHENNIYNRRVTRFEFNGDNKIDLSCDDGLGVYIRKDGNHSSYWD